MATVTSAPPTSCEYETASGAACPNQACFRLVFRDAAAPASLSGEAVKYFGHACHGHLQKAKRAGGSIQLESVEEL